MSSAIPQLSELATLTIREYEVLHWVAEGKTNRDIGKIIICSEGTVKKHLQHIFAKLGVETRIAAAITYLQRSSKPSAEHRPTDTAPDVG